MLNDYLQQWCALQTVRAADLDPHDVVAEYLSAGGDSNASHFVPADTPTPVIEAILRLLERVGPEHQS